MMSLGSRCMVVAIALPALLEAVAATPDPSSAAPFRINVVEKGSGWPVPMVQLRTTHGVQFISDNAGVVAFDVPELMDKECWLTVSGHGYERPADGFGFRGVRVRPEPGRTFTVEVTRTILARRLGRLTGGGLFAESQKLRLRSAAAESGELGRDSIQGALHEGRMFWAWGDTTLPGYPLGLFHMSGATSPVLALSRFEPPLEPFYTHFASNNIPVNIAQMPGPGPTWLSGFASLKDGAGKSHLVASYAKIKPPLEAYERGLCEWDPAARHFKKLTVVWTNGMETIKKPLVPDAHLARWSEGGTNWILFGNPFPVFRCEASYEAYTDPAQWSRVASPAQLIDVRSGKAVKPHSGSIAYNEFRKKWVAVFTQAFGEPSVFGEVWFAEAASPFGPWSKSVKVLSHDNYTFYNPRIDHELTPPGAGFLLFEGTFTADFANKAEPWPRHNYNQVLYRLDFEDLPTL